MSIQTGTPWAGGPTPILGDGWLQLSSGKVVSFLEVDTLTPAEQSEVLAFFLSPQSPLLPPPQVENNNQVNFSIGTVSASHVAMQLDESKHQIIISMLDSWIANIQEQAERNKEAAEKRAIEAMSIAFHEYRHAAATADPNFPLFTVGLIIAGTGVQQAIMPTLDANIAITPVLDMYSKTAMQVFSDLPVQLGMIGAIYSLGAQYFAVAQTSSNGTSDKAIDPKFAKGYAENIISVVNSPDFNSYVMALLTHPSGNGEPLSEGFSKEMVAMLKLVLLSSALALLYQVEAGKMTSLEFGGMLNGTIKFDNGDIRATLISMIKAAIKEMPKTGQMFLNALLEYFDSNPALDSLAKPAHVLAGVNSKLPTGDIEG